MHYWKLKFCDIYSLSILTIAFVKDMAYPEEHNLTHKKDHWVGRVVNNITLIYIAKKILGGSGAFLGIGAIADSVEWD